MRVAKTVTATALAVALVSIVTTGPAAAGIITLDDNFTAKYSPGIPLASLSGSFSVTFDNSASFANVSGTGLTLLVSGISLAGATEMFAYSHPTDIFQLGAFSAGNFVTNGGTNYFDLTIQDVSTAPTFATSQYSQVGDPNNGFLTGSLTSVPEPASLLLFSAGLLGLGAMRRRHKRIP